jgi:hypothetical protein
MSAQLGRDIGAKEMFLRILAGAAALAAPAVASASVIHLDSPKGGDKLLAQEAEHGRGPPAQGLWTRTTVTVDPKTGSKTTITIVANRPVADPPTKAALKQP